MTWAAKAHFQAWRLHQYPIPNLKGNHHAGRQPESLRKSTGSIHRPSGENFIGTKHSVTETRKDEPHYVTSANSPHVP